MKQFYFPFYPGDWKKDTAVSMCGLAARGFWLEIICAMHELDRSGKISGTHEQLARVARCSVKEVGPILAEITTQKVADVTESNGVVTLVCRRMKRESKEREATRLRVNRHRRNAAVTGHVTEMLQGQSELELQSQLNTVPPLPPGGGRKKSSAKEPMDCRESELIYYTYPLKVGKPVALRAIEKALKKETFEHLLERTSVMQHLWLTEGTLEFCPHPSTWFNQERYNDDPETWKPRDSRAATNGHRRPTTSPGAPAPLVPMGPPPE